MTIALGRYTQTEVPPPLEYTFEDINGDVITDIDDTWTVTFRFRRQGDTSLEGTATADAGVATYVWVEGDMDTPGIWKGEFIADNGTNRFISERIVWLVIAEIPEAGS